VPVLKRFALTIEVEVGPEYFVYRCGQKENRVLARGYIRAADDLPGIVFEVYWFL
jgi:GGDEF domain-containing protein